MVVGGTAGPGTFLGSCREWSGSVCQSQSKICLMVLSTAAVYE